MNDELFMPERCLTDINYFQKNRQLIFKMLISANKKKKDTALKIIKLYYSPQYIDDVFKICNAEKDQKYKLMLCELLRKTKSKKIINPLLQLLKDKNPLIVAQAFLGLLAYRDDPAINSKLKKLLNHPNEIVKETAAIHFAKKDVATKPSDFKLAGESIKNLIINGDVNKILQYFPKESIDLTFTSPPYYNAKDYSIFPSYSEYLKFLKITFQNIHNVTKDGRFFIINTSPVIMPRVDRQYNSKRYAIPFDLHPILIDIGWEFIDDIVWAKPESSVKNRNGGFFQHRKPLAYKPNACTEYVMVYRKKSNNLIDWNIKQYSKKIIEASLIKDEYPRSNLWNIMPQSSKEHSAVFPYTLADNIIKLYSMKNDLVFDPFGGSGTAALASINNSRKFVITEISSKFCELIEKNIKKTGSAYNYLSAKDWIKKSKFNC